MAGKPIKRNENIVPLSKDHHLGLLFCWKVRQGVKKGVEASRINRYIQHFWEIHLKQHFEEEETILFNRVENELCKKALAQHAAIRELVSGIDESINNVPEACLSLASLIDGHIRFEERILFPFLESVLTAEMLAEVGIQLNNVHISCSTDNYDDEFWLTEKKAQ